MLMYFLSPISINLDIERSNTHSKRLNDVRFAESRNIGKDRRLLDARERQSKLLSYVLLVFVDVHPNENAALLPTYKRCQLPKIKCGDKRHRHTRKTTCRSSRRRRPGSMDSYHTSASRGPRTAVSAWRVSRPSSSSPSCSTRPRAPRWHTRAAARPRSTAIATPRP